MSNSQLLLAVLGLTAVGVLFFGPGMWSESWGWDFLDRLFKPKTKTKPPAQRAPLPGSKPAAPPDDPPKA
jgi:hypothetical protein